MDGTAYAAVPPRPMTVEEIKGITKDFADAAKRCIEAGFDGVEIHREVLGKAQSASSYHFLTLPRSANGYLLEQFLHDNVNKRTDAYGGSVENRCRFSLEVVKAVTAAVGADRVGIRLSPYDYFQDTRDSNPNAHWAYLCKQIAELPTENRVSYVHMVEPRFDDVLDEQGKMDALATYSKDAAEGVEAEVTTKSEVNSWCRSSVSWQREA
jgi:2,4-dienoyl-CoA reductase-like NADH-dependent reductase (Old Yellow Enzyme family)